MEVESVVSYKREDGRLSMPHSKREQGPLMVF